jgi:5-methylcytosine-specific restriction protein A
MASTKGHGNPKWGRDETILALELYFEVGTSIPSEDDARVAALSRLLRSLPHHAHSAKRPTFRNSAGVAFKLQNLRQVATGKGLGNVSGMDREIWREFGSSPLNTKAAADLIRASVEELKEDVDDGWDEEEMAEGRVVARAHARRERNPKVRAKLIRARENKGALSCEICEWRFVNRDRRLNDAPFEAHHKVPLSLGGERKTRLADMALLCANCHRLIHRAMKIHKRWITVEEAKAIRQ